MKAATLTACLAGLLISACGQAPNDLWGSIDESFPLEFDRVEILRQNLALRIEYLKDVQGGENKVVKLTIDTDNINITKDSELRDDIFEQHVTLERVASTQSDFPPIEGGKIHFDEYSFDEGGRVDGDFTIVFENGRNLNGTFDGKLKIVSTQ